MFIKSLRWVQNQYIAAFSASLTLTMCGASFVWPSPILPLLQGPNAIISMDATQISWMIALIEVGSLFSPVISGCISDWYGRKPGILIAGPPLIVSWIMILVTRDVHILYIVRILQGLSVGVLFTAVPIYLGEIAAVNVRGGITALLQTMWYSGILLQITVGSYLSYNNSVIVNLFLSTIIFFFFFLTQTESPFFYMKQNREDDASKSLVLLRGKKFSADVAIEMQNIKECVTKDMNNKTKLTEILNLSWVECRIVLIVQALSFFRLASGTLTFSEYIHDLLRRANWEAIPPEVIMTFYSCVTLVTISVATLTIDSFGRRPLLLISCIGTGICNFALGSFYWIDSTKNDIIDLSSMRWFPTVGLIFYTLFFGVGLGPVTQTIQSELFPTHLRAVGNIITSYNLTIVSFVTLRFYQILVDFVGVYANFYIYSVNCIIGALIIYIYVPETKGKTFLEISEYFHCKDNKDKTKSLENSRM